MPWRNKNNMILTHDFCLVGLLLPVLLADDLVERLLVPVLVRGVFLLLVGVDVPGKRNNFA